MGIHILGANLSLLENSQAKISKRGFAAVIRVIDGLNA